MISNNIYRMILLTVFLATVGMVSIYQIGPINFRPYQIPLLLSLIILFLQVFLHKRKLYFPGPYLSAFLSLFLLMAIISIIPAKYPIVTIKQLILLCLYIIISFLISNTCDSDRKLLLLSRAIILSGLVACIYGLIRMVSEYGKVNPDYFYFRAQSYFKEPNEFGQFLVFFFGYFFSEVYSCKKITKKFILWAFFLLIMFLWVLNMSRGAWIGCIVIVIFVIYAQNKSGLKKIYLKDLLKVTIILIVSIYLTLVVAPKIVIMHKTQDSISEIIKSRIVTFGEDITILSRFDLNMEAMKIMRKNPLTGIGFGNVFTIIKGGIISDQSGLNGIPMIGNATTTNFLADIAAETGVIGLTSFTIFLILLFKRGVKTIKNIRDEKMLIVFIGAFASCIGLFVTGLTSYPILLMPFFWISAGILTLRPYMWKTLRRR